jgi:hypothetical protein
LFGGLVLSVLSGKMKGEKYAIVGEIHLFWCRAREEAEHVTTWGVFGVEGAAGHVTYGREV